MVSRWECRRTDRATVRQSQGRTVLYGAAFPAQSAARRGAAGLPANREELCRCAGLASTRCRWGCPCADPPPCRTVGLGGAGRRNGSHYTPRTASRLKLEMGPPSGAALRGSGGPSCDCRRRWWTGQVPGRRAILKGLLAKTPARLSGADPIAPATSPLPGILVRLCGAGRRVPVAAGGVGRPLVPAHGRNDAGSLPRVSLRSTLVESAVPASCRPKGRPAALRPQDPAGHPLVTIGSPGELSRCWRVFRLDTSRRRV